MIKLKGRAVSEGIAIGRPVLIETGDIKVKREKAEDSLEEWRRVNEALGKAVSELDALSSEAKDSLGEAEAGVFSAHRAILEDSTFLDFIKDMIETEKVSGEYAVARAGENFSQTFLAMEDEYIRERAADVKDAAGRLLSILTERKTRGSRHIPEGSVVFAHELTPTDTLQMNRKNVAAFVTSLGSTNSHAAILARAMGIPAVTGIDPEAVGKGSTVIADGYEGLVYIDPEEDVIEEYRKRQKELLREKEELESLKGKPAVTGSGKRVLLYANIGGPSDLEAVKANDAEGIGLLRSEFLYLSREDYPSEEELFQVYRTVLESMAGKKVIIRTLDIGSDKKADYFNIAEEENPALGFRAIRICLKRPEIFKIQLRAIMRAGAYGNAAVMYPMITSLREVREIKRIAEEVKSELEAEGIEFKRDIEQGIMIETPAAAIISDLLAGEVDFFSIGTNDLTQYTLAADRQNTDISEFYDPCNEAVLRLIDMAIKNAHAAGIKAGICGELAADPRLTETFVNMGADELSMSPRYILPIRRIIRSI